MYTITHGGLQKLLDVNHFPVSPTDPMLFFGIRGCLPLDPEDSRFGTAVRLRTVDVNYANPRCTLIQWKPAGGTAAAYPGSTVPNVKFVRSALKRDGAGANQLFTGYYPDYRKGKHNPGTPYEHDAFRETASRPILRTADDLKYELDDRVELDNPSDNLHAAWSQGLADGYSSAGCQVVVGFPRCAARGAQPDTGPWKAFREAAYAAEGQTAFGYVLLDGAFVERVAADPSSHVTARLRFGSRGDLVSTLQEVLSRKQFYEGKVDGQFGPRTLRAVLQAQRSAFGPSAADGIVGPQTATALGIAPWPSI